MEDPQADEVRKHDSGLGDGQGRQPLRDRAADHPPPIGCRSPQLASGDMNNHLCSAPLTPSAPQAASTTQPMDKSLSRGAKGRLSRKAEQCPQAFLCLKAAPTVSRCRSADSRCRVGAGQDAGRKLGAQVEVRCLSHCLLGRQGVVARRLCVGPRELSVPPPDAVEPA